MINIFHQFMGLKTLVINTIDFVNVKVPFHQRTKYLFHEKHEWAQEFKLWLQRTPYNNDPALVPELLLDDKEWPLP